MTSKEFIIWLGGFLDASDTLTEEGIEFLKNKIKEVSDPYVPSPGDIIYPNLYVDYSLLCPMGGDHDYPNPWHSITPAPCKKCGQSLPSYTVTCFQDGSTNCCLNHVDIEPVPYQYRNYNMEDMQDMLNSANDVNKDAPKPDGYMDYIPPYTKMNWEIPVSEDAWKKPLEVKIEGEYWEEDGQKYLEFEVELNDEDRELIGTDKRYARFKAPIKLVPEELKQYGTGQYMFDFKTTEGQDSYKELMERKIREASGRRCIKIMP